MTVWMGRPAGLQRAVSTAVPEGERQGCAQQTAVSGCDTESSRGSCRQVDEVESWVPVERGGLKSEGGRDSWEHFQTWCAGQGLQFGAQLDPDKRMLT